VLSEATFFFFYRDVVSHENCYETESVGRNLECPIKYQVTITDVSCTAHCEVIKSFFSELIKLRISYITYLLQSLDVEINRH
jgi:hypothetical protein